MYRRTITKLIFFRDGEKHILMEGGRGAGYTELYSAPRGRKNSEVPENPEFILRKREKLPHVLKILEAYAPMLELPLLSYIVL